MLVARTLIFTVLAPGTVTVVVPLLLAAADVEPVTYELGALALAGIPLILLGVAIYAWCASDFILAGRGTPAPIDAPRALVSRGLYGLVRNPMYIGVALILVGEGLALQSVAVWIYAAVVLVGFHLFVVFYEEPSLRRRFGSAYEEYCQTVPRWIPHAAGGAGPGRA